MSRGGLVALAPDAAEAWLRDARAPGWVSSTDLSARAQLAREVAALEARRAAIETELAELRAAVTESARAEGLAQAAAGTAALEGALRAADAARASAAVAAVLAATEAVIRETVALDPQLVARRVEQLVGARAAAVLRVRVAPEVARATQQLDTRGFALVADPTLQGIDAVVELPSGQLDARLATVLPVLGAEIEALLQGAVDG